MNSAHGDEHEAMLSDLLAGAEDPHAALRASEAGGCAVCRAELDALLAARERLESAGRGMRATLSAAAQMRQVPGEERNAASLRRWLSDGTGPDAAEPARSRKTAARTQRPSARMRVWLGLAAAAALAIVFWRWRGAPSDPRDTQPLGHERLIALEPVGPAATWHLFRWAGTLPERGWFLVRLRGTSDDGQAWKQESPHLREAQWTPAATDGWPRAIEWEVHSYTASGEPFDSCSAQASLSD